MEEEPPNTNALLSASEYPGPLSTAHLRPESTQAPVSAQQSPYYSDGLAVANGSENATAPSITDNDHSRPAFLSGLAQEQLPLDISKSSASFEQKKEQDGQTSSTEENIEIVDANGSKIVVMEEADDLPLDITDEKRCICGESTHHSSELIRCIFCKSPQHLKCAKSPPPLSFICPECQAKRIPLPIFPTRPTLPLLLPAPPSRSFPLGSAAGAPPILPMPNVALSSNMPKPGDETQKNPVTTKRGRKPKASSPTLSTLSESLLSKETLPPSFENLTIASLSSSLPPTFQSHGSTSFIPMDHLRISNHAKAIIQGIWKCFYASALTKYRCCEQKSHLYYFDPPVVLEAILKKTKTEIPSLFSILEKEVSIGCCFWQFIGEGCHSKRSLRLITRTIASPFSSKGVFIDDFAVNDASKVIMPGTFIGMLTGTLLTVDAIRDELKAETQRTEKNVVEVAQYYLFFHPTLPLVVDARRSGNIARFIRRSCRPNAELRGLFVGLQSNGDSMWSPSTFNIAVFSTRRIRAGIDEILLPLDNNEFYYSLCPGPHLGRFTCLSPFYFAKNEQEKDIAEDKPQQPPPHPIITSSPQKASFRSPPRSKGTSSKETAAKKKKHTITSPSSPAVSSSPAVTLSREERKLKMYLESIERLEQREKRRQR